MFLPGDLFMAEFARCSVPVGSYASWWIAGLAPAPADAHAKALPGIGYMALNTVIGAQRNIVYTRRSLEKRITKYGFEIIDAGADYTTSFKPRAQRGERIAALRLPETFAGLPTLHEVCAVRK